MQLATRVSQMMTTSMIPLDDPPLHMNPGYIFSIALTRLCHEDAAWMIDD